MVGQFPHHCFMGEAPGADEDAQGIPFVGRAGKLLTTCTQNGTSLVCDKTGFVAP